VSPVLIALLGMMLVPLFIGTWRGSLLGLCCQGWLLAFIAHRLHPGSPTWQDWVTFFDLAVVRGVAVPLALYRVQTARKAPARNDVIPPNLLSWTFALGIVLMAFRFAETLVTQVGEERTLVAVAAAGVMLGFLVLSTQAAPFSQMIGALRIENAVALLALGSGDHEEPAVQIGLVVVFIGTAAMFRWYLAALGEPAPSDAPAVEPGGPTL
jgi:hydrogenase-4 membrane subunit HyfE